MKVRRVGAAVLGLLGGAPAVVAGDAPPPALLTEITRESGIEFVHDPGAAGEYRMPEIMGSGGGFLDFDGDGDLDIYLLQAAGSNVLYRQEENGRFTDVTAVVGGGDRGYGMGIAVGDYDQDGFPDLYVTNHGPDRLLRNEGGRRLVDVTADAGIEAGGWSTSAVFCDYDVDGDLDLYVARYVRDDPKRFCRQVDGRRDYCSPQAFPGTPDLLFRNEGGGRFQDASAGAGLDKLALPGLGVVCADLSGDGRPDFYVANDGTENNLWVSQADGTLLDEAFLRGVALNGMGRAEAGMGIAVGDTDGDLDADLFLTHLRNESNTLYLDDGVPGFEDVSAGAGLGAVSLPTTGFGTGFFDLDHDGAVDLGVVNGRVAWYTPLPETDVAAQWVPFAEPNLLFRNAGGGKFEDVSDRAGRFASRVEISRALILGDVDGDGDVDLLVTQTAGPARLFRNDAPKLGSWLQIRAVVPGPRRDAYGARITLETTGGGKQVRWVHPGYGYLSSNDPRTHFGIPAGEKVAGITVRWPDGAQERFPGGDPGRHILLRQGDGRPIRD